MPSLFQPEKPNAPSKRTQGHASYVVPAVIGALFVMMLFALAVPRVLGSGEANWLVTIGAGVLTLLLVLGYGRSRKA